MLSLHSLARHYQRMNGSHYETLHGPPSALKFAQLVHISRPVLFKDCNLVTGTWTDEDLIAQMGDTAVAIAITPDGRADAIVHDDNDTPYFVEPMVELMSMSEFLSKLCHDPSGEVCYLQSQNGNIHRSSGDAPDFANLQARVPKDIPWATEALGASPDAVNIWIGDERSVTTAHCDPYENIYFVVSGTKQFTLFPPTEGFYFEETYFNHARYTRDANGMLSLTPSPPETPQIRWTSNGDLSKPMPGACPIIVVVAAGDALYLPVGWWHHVQQIGKTVAINWWYDAEARGMNATLLNILRYDTEADSDPE